MMKKRRVEAQGVAMEEGDLLAGVRVVCREHPHVQALDHVTKMIDEFVDLPETWKLSDAVKTRSFRLVARVAASFGSGSTRNDNEEEWQYDEGLQYAAIIGNLALVQRLSEWISTPLDRWGVISAALSGDLTLLQWAQSTTPELFHEHPGMWVEHVAFDVAAERGCSETVQWLVEAFPDTVWSLGPAALGGHLELVKWLHQNANLVDMPARVTPDGMQRAFFDKFCDRFQECNNGEEVPEAVQWRFSYW